METSLVHEHVPPPTSPTADPKCLLELPPDTLLEVFLWAELDALNQIQRASQQCRLLARAATASHSWRARRPCNVQSLALSRLEAGAVSSEALHGLSGGVRSLAFERDLLVSGTKDNLARVWGCRTLGTCFAEHLHPQWVGAVALTAAAGGLLATGCDDGRIRVWSTDVTSLDTAPLELKGHSESWIVGVGWIQGWIQGSGTDGGARPPRLLSCSRDGEIALWDVNSQRMLHNEYDRPVRDPGSRSSVLVTAFDVFRDAAVVARTSSSTPSRGEHEEIVLYRVREPVHGEAQPPLPRESARARCFEGPCLEAAQVIAPRRGAVDRGPVLSLALDRGSGSKFGSGSGWIQEASRIGASGSKWGVVHLWDFRTGECTATLENGCAGGIRGLALCGYVLAVGRDPGPLLNVWDLRRRRIVQRLRGHTNNDALAMVVEPARGRLACGGRMNELRVWDLYRACASVRDTMRPDSCENVY